MYNIDINVEYNDNATYRQCLRQVMNMDVSGINFDQYEDWKTRPRMNFLLMKPCLWPWMMIRKN